MIFLLEESTSLKTPRIHSISKQVIASELLAIASILVLIWLDELVDIPHLFFRAELTPINWKEALLESSVIAFFGIILINYTKKIFHRIKYLEGILPVCASCKKIRDEKGDWHQIESFIRDRSEAEFSHSICPGCAKKLYPELTSDKEKKEAQSSH